MLKIHQYFFIRFMGLLLAAMMVAGIVGYLSLRSLMIELSTTDLKHAIAVFSSELPQHRNELDTYARRFHEMMDMRVTMIARDGTVLAESNHDKETMENHANRPEILASRTHPYGIATRYSATLGQDRLYVAKSIDYDHREVTLRLSLSLQHIFESYETILFNLTIVFAIFIVLSIIVLYNMSTKLQYDIRQLHNYLEHIANKDYKAVYKTRYFSEFLMISLHLKNLVKKLRNREKQKRKYTAKLRLINKQRTDMISSISHEFKNPLASIIGYAETLQDDPDINPIVRQRFLERVLSSAHKMTTMLDRLALSVKLDNDDLNIVKKEFDLCHLVNDVAQTLQSKYKSRKVHVACIPTRVYADATTMDLVITNLIDNALKYSEIDVHVSIENDRLNVVDRGIGIETDELEKVTAKYYRVNKNTWDNSMGLGLALVSHILKLNGTALDITSEFGKGSTFSFDLIPLLANQHEHPKH